EGIEVDAEVRAVGGLTLERTARRQSVVVMGAIDEADRIQGGGEEVAWIVRVHRRRGAARRRPGTRNGVVLERRPRRVGAQRGVPYPHVATEDAVGVVRDQVV